jgi:hypothetical protein
MTAKKPLAQLWQAQSGDLRSLHRVRSRHFETRLVEEGDYVALHRLRSAPEARHLRAIDSDPLSQLEYIRRARERAIAGEEIYWALSLPNRTFQPIGFLRISDLTRKDWFSFHSLVVEPKTARPAVAIDAIFSVMKIGFDVLGFSRTEGLTVSIHHERMLQIHRSMGILAQTHIEDSFVHLAGSRDSFDARRATFERLGFGHLCFLDRT